jgi:hypothetical protein
MAKSEHDLNSPFTVVPEASGRFQVVYFSQHDGQEEIDMEQLPVVAWKVYHRPAWNPTPICVAPWDDYPNVVSCLKIGDDRFVFEGDDSVCDELEARRRALEWIQRKARRWAA